MKMPPPTNSGSPSTTVIVFVAAILEISSRPQKTATRTAYCRSGRSRTMQWRQPPAAEWRGGWSRRAILRPEVPHFLWQIAEPTTDSLMAGWGT